MRTTDRYAPVRILIGLSVLVLAGWAAGRYMCRCSGAPTATETTVKISVEKLQAHVHALAGEIGERNVFVPEKLRRAADYIEGVWREQGYEVTRYPYQISGESWDNLEVTRPGTGRAAEIVLVGAHYDSVYGSPGANDNGTGVAAMLEISRVFAGSGRAEARPSRTVRFVAFVNEEPPFFLTGNMGSRVYAKMVRERGDDIRAMLSLETMGYYSEERRSQRYPPLFNFFYPDRGNFIAWVANFGSRKLLHKAVAAFRASTDFPAECVATFSGVPGVDWSDHGSFWQQGYRALMVTDTAPYRYPHYHTEGDTPDKVNYEALARVTAGVGAVVTALANDADLP